MNRKYLPIVLALFAILLFPAYGFAERGIRIKQNRLALVIGNGAYKSAPLKNPVNDAKDMASTLRNLGFDVMHINNSDRRRMEDTIRQFGRRLRHGGVGLFYYAGHGVQVDGRNYLIPVDAKIDTESDVKFEAVDAGRVLGKMEDAENELNIVILDACRDNPFARSFRTSSRGLARMDAPKGSIVVYATAPGYVAADGTGRNGIYTKHLLKHITVPGLTLEQVLKRVRVEVINETRDKQVPWESSSLTGEFYFVIEGKVTVTKRPKTETSMALEKEKERLESKRQELERLKMEVEGKKLDAEHERLKAEKERLEVASVPTKPSHTAPASHGAEIERDGIYIAYANGIVRDTETGLEWIAGPDRDTTWNDAKSWVESLNIAGGGRRMPAMDELSGLYTVGKGSRNMTPLLKTTGRWVWSGETKDSSLAWGFSFNVGYRTWGYRDTTYYTRAFAVRSRTAKSPAKLQYSPPVYKSGEIGRDGVYIAYANGIVRDTNTGLEWKVGPDKDTDWNEARSWVQSLKLNGGGWRMPTMDELKGLYKKGVGDRNITPLLKTTGLAVWPGMTKGRPSFWPFSFYYGYKNWHSRNVRAFAVRSQR